MVVASKHGSSAQHGKSAIQIWTTLQHAKLRLAIQHAAAQHSSTANLQAAAQHDMAIFQQRLSNMATQRSCDGCAWQSWMQHGSVQHMAAQHGSGAQAMMGSNAFFDTTTGRNAQQSNSAAPKCCSFRFLQPRQGWVLLHAKARTVGFDMQQTCPRQPVQRKIHWFSHLLQPPGSSPSVLSLRNSSCHGATNWRQAAAPLWQQVSMSMDGQKAARDEAFRIRCRAPGLVLPAGSGLGAVSEQTQESSSRQH